MSQVIILAAAGGSKGSRSYVSAVHQVHGAEYANDRQNALRFAVLDGDIDAAVAAARAAVAGEQRSHEILLVTDEVVSLIKE